MSPQVGLAERRRPPALLTTFVGRDVERTEIAGALESSRLVTITGPGGVGKTRLAIEVAAVVEDRYHHGTAFCDLLTMPSTDQFDSTVAGAVGASNAAGAGDRTLADYLANREVLLVIDNADRAVTAVAELAGGLLQHCPRLRILITSREPLRIVGERLIRLPPLATDHPNSAAVKLFSDRAALAGAEAPSDLDAVARLCRSLDGLPLAIELAASRLRSVPLEHLEPAVSGSPDALRSIVDWSVEALPAGQQSLLRRLAVFAGGCTAAAAAQVCGVKGDVVESLADLVDRSLVQFEHRSTGAHYRLLDTIRADGMRRLAEAGESDRFHARHLAWCLSLVPGDLGHGEDPTVVSDLSPELDNIVAALEWGLGGGDITGASKLAIATACHWVHAGRLRDARSWLERTVESAVPRTRDRRATSYWLGWVLVRQGDLNAAAVVLTDAIDSGTNDADEGQLAIDAEILLGTVEIESGDLPAGQTRLTRLTGTPDVFGNPVRRAAVGYGLGRRALLAGELPAASELLDGAVEQARRARMWHSLALGLTCVSQAEAARRHFPRAEGALAEALAVARGHRLVGLLPRILGAGATLAARTGDTRLARERFVESLTAARIAGDLRAEVATLTNLGALEQNAGQPMSAIAHHEEALALANRVSDDRIALRVIANLAESVLAGTRDTGRALRLAAEALARARPLGLRVSEVTALESAALALVERAVDGDLERAATLIGAAAAERETLDYALDAGSVPAIERAARRIAGAIGAGPAEAARAEGRRRGVDAVGEELLAAVARA